MTLHEYLDNAAADRWAWGTIDCTMFAADWVLAVTGRDPADGLRGTYASAEEAQAVIRREGGFLPMIRWRLEELGFAETMDPRDGDVGIIRVPTAMGDEGFPVVGAIMGIRHCGLWACRAARGVRVGEFPHLSVWRIE